MEAPLEGQKMRRPHLLTFQLVTAGIGLSRIFLWQERPKQCERGQQAQGIALQKFADPSVHVTTYGAGAI